MKQTHTTQAVSIRRRRIGRKALQADRIARALTATAQKKPRKTWSVPSVRPRLLAVVCAVIIGVSAAGLAASHFYTARAVEAQKAAAVAEQKMLKAKSVAADACRRKKAEQKADQLGKITYDELYDHGECDK